MVEAELRAERNDLKWDKHETNFALILGVSNFSNPWPANQHNFSGISN